MNSTPNKLGEESTALFVPPSSGIQTTEFWITMATNLLAVGVIALENSNAPWAMVSAALANAVYTTLRGALKHGYTQRASMLQNVGNKAAIICLGLFLACGSTMLTSCAAVSSVLGSTSFSFSREDFDLTIKTEDGIETYYYLHRSSGRQFRAVHFGKGWVTEVKDPVTGLWLKNGSKAGLDDLPDLPLPELTIPTF